MLEKEEKRKISDGFIIGFLFLSVLWIIKLIEINFDLSFVSLGIKPRTLSGLKGIFLTPLIHSNLEHLFNNSFPLFVAIFGITYYFNRVKFQILGSIYIISHFLIWLFARGDSYHIGASGLDYAYLSFLFFVSAFAKNKNMLAISLIILFLYGTMIWGIIPVDNGTSWESHLIGGIVGLAFALFYKNELPAPIIYDWEHDDENVDELTDEEINELIEEKRKEIKIKYWYKRKD